MQGDWIYYHNTNNYGLIYKMRSGGSHGTNLSDNDIGFIIKESDNRGEYINVVDDWIYYSSRNGGLFKVRTDGSSRNIVE